VNRALRVMKRSEKATTTSARVPSSTDPDRRVAALLDELLSEEEFIPVVRAYKESASATGTRKFGSNGLKVNGKLFALFTQGTLVVKLPNERVAELVASKVGRRFDPGHGRLMKGWLTVVSPKALWVDLAKESYQFVQGTRALAGEGRERPLRGKRRSI
jgi:TfoX/Sxy family transcriptional regulator of competence genes